MSESRCTISSIGRFYIGSTRDLEKRIIQHNAGKVKSTKPYRPYQLIYKEVFLTYTDARKREIWIKGRKSRRFILSLLHKSRATKEMHH